MSSPKIHTVKFASMSDILFYAAIGTEFENVESSCDIFNLINNQLTLADEYFTLTLIPTSVFLKKSKIALSRSKFKTLIPNLNNVILNLDHAGVKLVDIQEISDTSEVICN